MAQLQPCCSGDWVGKRETLAGKKSIANLLAFPCEHGSVNTLCFTIRNPELSRKGSRAQQALLREAVAENKMATNTCLGQAGSYIRVTCR